MKKGTYYAKWDGRYTHQGKAYLNEFVNREIRREMDNGVAEQDAINNITELICYRRNIYRGAFHIEKVPDRDNGKPWEVRIDRYPYYKRFAKKRSAERYSRVTYDPQDDRYYYKYVINNDFECHNRVMELTEYRGDMQYIDAKF